MRTTIKQSNQLLDSIKDCTGIKSRTKAEIFLYSKIAPTFKKHGFILSHYLNGKFSITVNHSDYFYISVDELFTPYMTISKHNH